MRLVDGAKETDFTYTKAQKTSAKCINDYCYAIKNCARTLLMKLPLDFILENK